MERFGAHLYWLIARTLETARVAFNGPAQYDKEFLEHSSNQMMGLKGDCEAIGLLLSAKFATKLAKSFKTYPINPRQLSIDLEVLSDRIQDEMSLAVFMHVPAARAARYDELSPFGSRVNQNFPGSAFDLWEAGNCYAAGRFTACVFHLMRGLECALTAFADVFGVPSDHTNWQNIIQGIESKVRDMGQDQNKASDWKEKQEFYSQAANSFMFFKDAWRNYTAHARGKYTEEEADAIFRNVGSFMKKLADGGIAEKKDWLDTL